MTVKELLEALQPCNPEHEVVAGTTDDSFTIEAAINNVKCEVVELELTPI